MNRKELEELHGEVWDTSEVQRKFRVIGFMAPFAEVVRKEDGARGTVEFQHQPRFYFCFEEA